MLVFYVHPDSGAVQERTTHDPKHDSCHLRDWTGVPEPGRLLAKSIIAEVYAREGYSAVTHPSFPVRFWSLAAERGMNNDG
jgi:hypothetical protein